MPAGPSFPSIDCRIEQLLAAVQAEGRLGRVQQKLADALQDAESKTQRAEAKCAGGDAKQARKRLRKAAREVTRVARILRSHWKGKTIPVEVAEALVQRADAIGHDAITLRDQLACSAA